MSLHSSNAHLDSIDDNKKRLIIELEFVQCLANPAYLNFLAQQGYFEDKAFLAYLKYLKYWKREPYIKLIEYPHCLYFLDMLCSEEDGFRKAIARNEIVLSIHEQQYMLWKIGLQYIPTINHVNIK